MSNAYTLTKRPNAIYGADEDWLRYHYDPIKRQHPKTPLWTCCSQFSKMANYIEGSKYPVWGKDKIIGYGGNSGFQSVNLAYFFGFRKIILLGYDVGYDPGTPKHFFGEHPSEFDRHSDYRDWLNRWRDAKPMIDECGVEIINASRRTALEVFERLTIDEALTRLRP